ncbi:uncharacterized protein MELLADRAFT_87531 [Melampsora larici-populina 98AG31]|uniref:Uncharacterized protein n=1 Tax=Melampsora larici-populina (strain 98AG31 / pathotype 3-4-7) TaxID=747676 RepID=F4RNN9_MELLP|nr:uncharacterized protein MELLADRAFT_87531 [Melampsora larici-populina 98AG31]EGG06018.1 hypothetical protein MELLADRAFT_87531 [Melampsora larici-populina 98AG31]
MDPKAVKDVVDRVKAEVGHPTIISNKAGVVDGKSIIDLSLSEIQWYVTAIHDHWVLFPF